MIRTKQFFLPVLLFVFTFSYGQNEKYVDSVRIANHIPELTYAVISADKIYEIHALGRHSILLPDSASLKDRFHIGSNTKALTTFMIAKYVEKSKLNWNDKFFDAFPEWKESSLPAYFNITLQDLLTHRALIQPFQGFDDPVIPDFKGSKKEKREAFGKFVLSLAPAQKDSSQTFVYSNAGYTLATLMLEKATHKSWEELVNKVFNKDLKLGVKLSWPENQVLKDTWGHSFEDGKLVPVPSNTDYHLDYTEPAGDLNIRITDYLKFVQLNLKGIQGHDNYLKAQTYKFIHTATNDYSLGWYNINENGKDWSNHTGTAGTYYTITHIDRQKNLAYIVFTNSFSEDTQIGVRWVMRKLKQQYTK